MILVAVRKDYDRIAQNRPLERQNKLNPAIRPDPNLARTQAEGGKQKLKG
jgi:hypothetical protein